MGLPLKPIPAQGGCGMHWGGGVTLCHFFHWWHSLFLHTAVSGETSHLLRMRRLASRPTQCCSWCCYSNRCNILGPTQFPCEWFLLCTQAIRICLLTQHFPFMECLVFFKMIGWGGEEGTVISTWSNQRICDTSDLWPSLVYTQGVNYYWWVWSKGDTSELFGGYTLMDKSSYLRRNFSTFWIALLYWTALYGYRHLICFGFMIPYICERFIRYFLKQSVYIFLGQAQLTHIYTNQRIPLSCERCQQRVIDPLWPVFSGEAACTGPGKSQFSLE